MRAVRINKFGGADAVSIEDVPRPEPQAGEALIRVHATSINPLDWKLREGMRKDQPLPFTPGGDYSGVVERVGEGVKNLEPGQEVYGCPPGSVGAGAEYVTAPANMVAAKPRTLGHVEAASVPLAAMTAWQALFEHGKLQMGQTLLVLGGSGGVGGYAIQLAKVRGAKVIATAATENVAATRELDADHVIDYKKQKIEEAVTDADLCVDLVGGEFAERALACLLPGGVMVSTVQPPAQKALKAKRVSGQMMIMKPKAENLREIAKLIDAGRVRVRVARVLPLDQAAEAEELNRRHEVEGKIVLQLAGAAGAAE